MEEFGRYEFDPATPVLVMAIAASARGTFLIRAKARNHAKTTPPSLSYPLSRYPNQSGVRYLINFTLYNTFSVPQVCQTV